MKTSQLSALSLASVLALTAFAPAASAHTTAPHGDHGEQGRHTRTESRIPFTEATVTAVAGGAYTVSWNAPGTALVTIRANGRVVGLGGSHGKITVRGLPATDRQWFTLDPSRGGSLRLADRLIALDGAVNFRDAGGYRTAGGQWVKMGEVYRSDALDKLTDRDLAKLRRLGVRTVFDLRMTSERTTAPDRVPARAKYVVADVLAGSDSMTSMPTTEAAAVAMMTEGERFMVGGTTAQAAYTKVFDGIAKPSAHGVLFHCTAGKDRTGWADAALLTALGVPRGTVMSDYLASNDYRAEQNAAALAQLPADQAKIYKPLLDVRPEYLNAGFDEVASRYGTFPAYLDRALGLDAGDVRELKRDLLVG